MSELGKTVANLLAVFYYWIESMILFFVPERFKMKDVTDELVLITGAGSGIGRLTAVKFAKRGANLVLWDIDEKGNDITAKMVREQGRKAHTYKVDITDKEIVYKTAAIVRQDVGVVTILVNNAGIVSGKYLLHLEDEAIEKVMNVNVLSHFWTIKAFLPDMIEHNHGHIVSISSLAGIGGINQLTDYCASKFAAVGLMESLGQEMYYLGKKNIHTTIICPFYINTGMFNGVRSKIFSILEPDYVAEEIVKSVLCNKCLVLIPRIFYFILILKALLPNESIRAFIDACVGNAMAQCEGRSLKIH